MASWAEAKKLHSNTVVGADIPMRGDLVDEFNRVEQAMLKARDTEIPDATGGEARKLATRLLEIQEEIADASVHFAFKGLGKGAYARLVAEHPPTPEQVKAADLPEGMFLPYNMATYPPALMAACCVEPAELKGNIEEWAEIHQDWSDGQVERLWRTCLTANEGVSGTPKSVAASEILGLRSSGTS